tara:strand:+ start:98 stop:766 length:669 start_codon:yes stop_codon:yes gene_type:complete
MDVTQFIWERLSAIPAKKIYNDKIETENGDEIDLPYVNWMHAHAAMMSAFPDYTWEFEVNPIDQGHAFYYGDTAEVRCVMTVMGKTQFTSLPVYDYLTRKPKVNPTSDDINTAKQRCRVKAMAEFGLYADLYMPEQRTAEIHNINEAKTPQRSKQPDDKEKLENAWKKARQGCRVSSDEELDQWFKKFANHLRTQGIEESAEDRSAREEQFRAHRNKKRESK